MRAGDAWRRAHHHGGEHPRQRRPLLRQRAPGGVGDHRHRPLRRGDAAAAAVHHGGDAAVGGHARRRRALLQRIFSPFSFEDVPLVVPTRTFDAAARPAGRRPHRVARRGGSGPHGRRRRRPPRRGRHRVHRATSSSTAATRSCGPDRWRTGSRPVTVSSPCSRRRRPRAWPAGDTRQPCVDLKGYFELLTSEARSASTPG